jgi:hypothetical protein
VSPMGAEINRGSSGPRSPRPAEPDRLLAQSMRLPLPRVHPAGNAGAIPARAIGAMTHISRPNGASPEIPRMLSAEDFEREVMRELTTGSEPRAPRFRIARFGEIRPDESARYLVKGLLPSTGLAVVWGAPKCGKSFWTFDLLMHVALGRPYRDHRVISGPIVYCALEGAQGFRNRTEAFRRAKMSETDDGDPPFYLMASPLSLVRDQKAFVAEIAEQLGEQKPVAVCIDTLNRSLDGSESSDEASSIYPTIR